MKLLAAVLLSAASSFPSFAQAQAAQPLQEQQAIAAAQQATEQWLAVLDDGRYTASWEQGAEALKKAVSQAQWEKGVRDVRTPFGAVKQRSLASSRYTTTLPGAPQGQYVVLEYASQFTDRPSAVETVIPVREQDGTWRVSGYFIR